MDDAAVHLFWNGLQLVLKTEGHDPLEEIKTQAAGCWVDAVNAGGRYEIAHDMSALPAAIDAAALP